MIQAGVTISSITFDGHPTNKAMCKMLGANFNVYGEDFKSYIIIKGRQIFVLYDVCHTEKLVRGHWDKKEFFIDENGNKVCWKFIEDLVKFGHEKGFSATHKLNRSHLNWRRRPMNVRIAVETLSKKTADSIEYLMASGCKEFIGATATVRFIRLFNDIFDIFNTKFVHDNENPLKNAMGDMNKNSIFELFDEAIEYIKKLKFRGEAGEIRSLCRSEARAGFMGFIINMRSLKSMYEKYVENEKLLPFIPTYFLNQDSVEMFFGKIRSRGGCDDNPDVVRFQAAYRKLLGIDSILQSCKGNCEAFQINVDPFSNILYVSSRRDQSTATTECDDELIVLEEVDKLQEKLAQINASVQSHLTDDMHNLTIAHIANSIEDKIKSIDVCAKCVEVFDSCTKIDGSFFAAKFMKKPCLSTFRICKEADKYLKLKLLQGDINFKTIYYSILSNLDVEHMFEEADFSAHSSHKLYLIKAVVDGYVRVKGLFLAKTATQDLHSRNFRYKFRKMIHFYGQ